MIHRCFDVLEAPVSRRRTVAGEPRDAGATSITIAVESRLQQILDEVVNEALKLDDVTVAAAALETVDIPCVVFFGSQVTEGPVC